MGFESGGDAAEEIGLELIGGHSAAGGDDQIGGRRIHAALAGRALRRAGQERTRVKKELQNSVLHDDVRRRFDAFVVELVPAEERLAVKIVDRGVVGDGQEIGQDAGADPIGESGVVVVDVFEARIVDDHSRDAD